jgi:hypothetical protein
MQARFRSSGGTRASSSSGIFTLTHQHGPLYGHAAHNWQPFAPPHSGHRLGSFSGIQNKNLQTPQNRRMKAFRKSRFAHATRGWPHPSLCGEVGPALRDHDERNQTGILTSGFEPRSRLPGCSFIRAAQWLIGVCIPLQWRNRSGFSPDSLTFDCDKDELAFTVFKEHAH